MSCHEFPDDVRILWNNAGLNSSTFAPDQLRREANRLQAKRRKGQAFLAGVMLIMTAAYGLAFLAFPNLLARVGGALTFIVCGYWLVHALMERARAAADPSQEEGLSFYRAELEHTRDIHRWLSWSWLLLLGPFILFDVGVAQIYAKVWPIIVPFACFDCALLLAVFAIWLPMKNFKSARKCQDRIDALATLSRNSKP